MPRDRFQQALSFFKTHLAAIQLAGVVLGLPPLIFPDHLPGWSVWTALAVLALLPVVGLVVGKRPWARTPLDLPIGVLLLLLPVNVLISADRALTLPHVYKLVAGAAIFYGLAGVLRTHRWFDLAAWAVGVLGIVLAGILLLSTKWSETKFSWLPLNVSGIIPLLIRPFWKAEGFAGFNANLAGGTLSMLLPVPIAYAVWGRKFWVRLAALLESGIVGALLLLTQSRGAIVALAAGLAVMLVAADWRWGLVAVAAVLGLIVAWPHLGLGAGLNVDLEADVASVLTSAEGRLELWSRGWYMMQDFVFTGVGMGMVVKVLPLLYPTFLIPPSANVEHLHNLYIHTGAELGFPGLIALLSLLIGLLALCWQAARRARGTGLAPLALSMLGVVVVYGVHGLTDTISFSPKAHLIAWALFGIAVSAGQYLLRPPDAPAHDAGAS